MTTKATKEQSKAHNRRLVLKAIYAEGPASRADIARSTGLTRTTVSAAVSEMIKGGLVKETGTRPSLGGKPPILLEAVDDCRLMVGVDLANSEFRGGLVDLRGRIKQRLSLPMDEQDGDAALARVYRLIDQLMAKSDRPILGIGIGTPGLMDAHRGVVRQAVNLSWRDLPLGDLLEARYRVPVYIANDCQVAALAELSFGNGRDANNLVVIKAGRGIGAGIVIDRRLYYGDDFGAGEIGHIVVQPGGKECRCGNRGCLEVVASSRALVQRAQVIFTQQPGSMLRRFVSSAGDINTQILLQALEAGDTTVRSMVVEAGAYLGGATASLVGGLNISHIVIAGSMARFGDALVRPIQQAVEGGILPALSKKMHVEISQLGQDIVILGAAALLLSHELGLA